MIQKRFSYLFFVAVILQVCRSPPAPGSPLSIVNSTQRLEHREGDQSPQNTSRELISVPLDQHLLSTETNQSQFVVTYNEPQNEVDLSNSTQNRSSIREDSTTVRSLPFLNSGSRYQNENVVNFHSLHPSQRIPENDSIDNVTLITENVNPLENTAEDTLKHVPLELPSINNGDGEHPEENMALPYDQGPQEGLPSLEHGVNPEVEITESNNHPQETLQEHINNNKNEVTESTGITEGNIIPNLEGQITDEAENYNGSSQITEAAAGLFENVSRGQIYNTSVSPNFGSNFSVLISVITTTKKPKRIYEPGEDHRRDELHRPSEGSPTLVSESRVSTISSDVSVQPSVGTTRGNLEITHEYSTSLDEIDSNANESQSQTTGLEHFSIQQQPILSHTNIARFTNNGQEMVMTISPTLSRQTSIKDSIRHSDYNNMGSNPTTFPPGIDIENTDSLDLYTRLYSSWILPNSDMSAEYEAFSSSSENIPHPRTDVIVSAQSQTFEGKDFFKPPVSAIEAHFQSDDRLIVNTESVDSHATNYHGETTLHHPTLFHQDVSVISPTSFDFFHLEPSSFIDFSESTPYSLPLSFSPDNINHHHTPVGSSVGTVTPVMNINCIIHKCDSKETEAEKSIAVHIINPTTSSEFNNHSEREVTSSLNIFPTPQPSTVQFITREQTSQQENATHSSFLGSEILILSRDSLMHQGVSETLREDDISQVTISPYFVVTSVQQIISTSTKQYYYISSTNYESGISSMPTVNIPISDGSTSVNQGTREERQTISLSSHTVSDIQTASREQTPTVHRSHSLFILPTRLHQQINMNSQHLSNIVTSSLTLIASTPELGFNFGQVSSDSLSKTTRTSAFSVEDANFTNLSNSTIELFTLTTPHHFSSSLNSNMTNLMVPDYITSVLNDISETEISFPMTATNSNLSATLTIHSTRNVTHPFNHSAQNGINTFARPKKTTTPKPGEQKPTGLGVFIPFPTVNSNASNEGNKPPLFISVELSMTWIKFCEFKFEFFKQIKSILQEYAKRYVGMKHIVIMNSELNGCHETNDFRERRDTSGNVIFVQFYLVDNNGQYDIELMENCAGYIKDGGFNFNEESYFKDKLLEVKVVRPTHENVLIVQSNTNSDKILGPGITVVIVIAVIGGLCCTVLIFLQLVLIKRRYGRRMRTYIPGTGRYSIRSVDNISLASVSKNKKSRAFFNFGLDVDETDPSHILNYAGLLTFSRDVDGIHDEFYKIPNSPCRLSDLPPGIAHKNRFSNVLPYNHSRVKLDSRDGDMTGYINASFIAGYMDEKRAYIATQAPLEHTVEDFWTMAWEQHCRVIIMLTALNEDGRKKCYRYWPDCDENDNKMSIGDFIIVNKKEEIFPDYIMSLLELKNIEKNLVREVYHFKYTAWPSHGVPALPEPISLIKFIIDSRAHYEDSGAPVIIHCCSGTGRTGCFITMDINMRMFEDRRRVDVLNILFKSRLDRQGCVQTKEQYTFIYKGLTEYAMVLNSPSISTASSQITINAI